MLVWSSDFESVWSMLHGMSRSAACIAALSRLFQASQCMVDTHVNKCGQLRAEQQPHWRPEFVCRIKRRGLFPSVCCVCLMYIVRTVPRVFV